ncbi:MAG: hypothetical protein RL213_1215 [Bacteroidota bacterium]|jgi:hypothetical protein
MKKSLLSALLIVTGAIGTYAQSFQATSPGTSLSGPANVLMSAHATVTNTSGGSIFTKVKRIQNDTAAGHNSYFCWGGACFPASTAISPFYITLNPGDVDTTLQVKLDPMGHPGVSTVTYCFYDKDNASDSVCITYEFTAQPVSVEELSGSLLAPASPNPADPYTVIGYQTLSRNAKLVISNLLGAVVREIPLSDRQNSVVVNTEDLNTGVYLYSLQQDGKQTATRKLVVNHK